MKLESDDKTKSKWEMRSGIINQQTSKAFDSISMYCFELDNIGWSIL